MKKYLLVIFGVIMLLPNIVSAKEDVLIVPKSAMDPRCFNQVECTIARKENPLLEDLTDAEIAEGFYLGTDAVKICGVREREGKTESLGFCIPGTIAKTQISFGGKRSFANIGEFIQVIYRYSISIIGIIAVVMIIIGGVQWMTSGGSKDGVMSGQKKITASVTGLIIAALSYVILNTINPALVNLRLPQVWMLNKYVSMEPGDDCRTEGPALEACKAVGAPGDYVCRPYKSDRDGPCDYLEPLAKTAFYIVVTSYIPGSGAVVAGTAMVAKDVGVGITKYITTKIIGGRAMQYISLRWSQVGINFIKQLGSEATKKASINLAENAGKDAVITAIKAAIANPATKKDALKALSVVVAQGAGTVVRAGGGIVAVGYGTKLVIDHELYKIFNDPTQPGLAGVCMPSFKKQNGEFCNRNEPNECASKKCIDIGGITSCWDNHLIMGVCSDGLNGSQCADVGDCKEGLNCVTTTIAGRDGEKRCSDGSQNSSCGEDTDCATGGICTYDKDLRRKLCEVTIKKGEEGYRCYNHETCMNNTICLIDDTTPRLYGTIGNTCIYLCTSDDNCSTGKTCSTEKISYNRSNVNYCK